MFGDDFSWAIYFMLIIGLLTSRRSAQAREIRQHMTADEQRAYIRFAILHGLSCVSVALLFTFLLLLLLRLQSMLAAGLVLPLLGLLLWKWAPRWFNKPRRFLASTAWARGQGIKPENIRLFKWEERAWR